MSTRPHKYSIYLNHPTSHLSTIHLQNPQRDLLIQNHLNKLLTAKSDSSLSVKFCLFVSCKQTTSTLLSSNNSANWPLLPFSSHSKIVSLSWTVFLKKRKADKETWEANRSWKQGTKLVGVRKCFSYLIIYHYCISQFVWCILRDSFQWHAIPGCLDDYLVEIAREDK